MVEYPQCHVLVSKKLERDQKTNSYTSLPGVLGVRHEPQNDRQKETPYPGRRSKVQKGRAHEHTEGVSERPTHPQGLTPADEENGARSPKGPIFLFPTQAPRESSGGSGPPSPGAS